MIKESGKVYKIQFSQKNQPALICTKNMRKIFYFLLKKSFVKKLIYDKFRTSLLPRKQSYNLFKSPLKFLHFTLFITFEMRTSFRFFTFSRTTKRSKQSEMLPINLFNSWLSWQTCLFSNFHCNSSNLEILIFLSGL